MSPSRIVVGVDGSPQSGKALQWALRQAMYTGSDVDAVACWQWPAAATAVGPYVDMDLAAPTRSALSSLVDETVAAIPGAAEVTVTHRVLEGYAARVLLEAAEGAELLVVGSRGHNSFSGLLLGSVGLHCASRASCPVVIVRPKAEHVVVRPKAEHVVVRPKAEHVVVRPRAEHVTA